MAIEGNQLATFGDTRRLILDTIQALKAGELDVSRGMAVNQTCAKQKTVRIITKFPQGKLF